VSFRISPDEAIKHINRLRGDLSESWLDLALQQDCTAMADCPSLRAWQDGREEESVRLLLDPGYLESAGMKEFVTVSRARKAAGVKLMRILVVDEGRRQEDPACRAYLDWLREFFRQVNIPWGGEVVHSVPMSECIGAGLTLPQDDVAIFDGQVVMTSQYGPSGQLESRTFYRADSDPAMLSRASSLMARVSGLIEGGSYLLRPSAAPAPYPW
jgi:uncharacterized protein DUF6879